MAPHSKTLQKEPKMEDECHHIPQKRIKKKTNYQFQTKTMLDVTADSFGSTLNRIAQ